MQAMFHNAAFIARGRAGVRHQREVRRHRHAGRQCREGRRAGESLGDKDIVLMRAHGSVATGPSLPVAVFRAVYTEMNARLQFQTTMLGGGGPIAALSPGEGKLADQVNLGSASRAWELWKRRVGF